jgi:L-fuculose-phosphate aldolase
MSKRNELNLKKEIVKTMELLYDKNLVTPTGGNVSARLRGSDHFWITPSGQFKGDLKVRDLVRVTLEGKGYSGRLKPSVETPLHSKLYRTREDVCAFIHAHSPLTLGTALAGIEIKPVTPEGVLFVGEVPIVQFETPGTEDLANKVVEMLKSHQVAVMQNHGVVAVGRNLLEALNRIEIVEITARIMTVAHIWGGTPTLTASQLEKLRSLATV